MSDLDDLVAALIKGDPNETVPTDIVTAMAQAAIAAHWIPCPHTEFVSDYDIDARLVRRACQRCGATDEHDVQAPADEWLTWNEATDG